jgi:hypothetical protein
MNVISNFVIGLTSVLRVTSVPLLYRYPYRTSAEGLKSDWNKIGDDIDSVMGKLESEVHDGK